MIENSEIPVYTISTAAKLLGISVHTIRMYENEGLIIPYKKTSNQRLYSENDLERMRCIRKSINEDRIGIEGIRRLLALIPCWGIIKCTASDRANCEMYITHSKPCWTLKHKNNSCLKRNCRECEVYTGFGNCSSIKEKFKVMIK